MIGKQIAHYQITEKLGEGGMGVVYRAEDTRLHRTVALKFLPPQATRNEEDRRRFTAEARAAAGLDHPNICTVYEIGEDDDRLYISMAYIEGESVKERVDRDGALSPLEAARTGYQMAEGLAAAHDRGIVHRDIKSANVMVDPRGQARIMDFGLAHTDGVEVLESDTSTAGTVAYASPEQTTGDPTDSRTDIWSFGVTLYEMVTGQLPFKGDYASAIIYSVINESPKLVSEVRPELPAEIDAVISRCLAKDPKDRYSDTHDLVAAMRDIQHALDPNISRVRSGVAHTRDARPWQKRLGDRATISAVAAYAVLCLAIFWVVGVASERLMLSPHIDTLVLVLLASLIPTVAILGARGRGRALLVIPANIIAAIALVAFVFAGEDLGATTRQVSVTNEDGETVTRSVPRSAYRKRVALYPFENATGDADNDWLAIGAPTLVEHHLYQDPFVQLRGLFNRTTYRRLKRAGFQEWKGVPVSLKARLAREANMPYFVTGNVQQAGDEYVVDFQVVDSQTGRSVLDETHHGPDLFSLMDEVSERVKSGIGVPEWHTDDAVVVPASQTVTNSMQALREYSIGLTRMGMDSDWPGAIEHFEAATRADSTLAFAWYDLFTLYRTSNRRAEAQDAVARAMRHSYKMPERHKLLMKANYYYFLQQPDKALTLTEMMVELYPDDTQGWVILAAIHNLRGEQEEAMESYTHLLELDPHNYGVILQLGSMHLERGEYPEALEYYERYAGLNPEEPRSFLELGDVYRASGDFDNARKNYERASLLDPQRVEAVMRAADLDRRLGRFDEAYSGYEEALTLCTSPEDFYSVYSSMVDYYQVQGRIQKVLEYQEKRFAEMAKYNPPVAVQGQRMETMHSYVEAGEEQTALDYLAEMERVLQPPLDKMIAFGYAGVHIARRDPDAAAKYVPGIDEYITAFRIEVIRYVYWMIQSRVLELQGDHQGAIEVAQLWADKRPGDMLARLALGRCYREMGDNETALGYLREVEKQEPYNPDNCYQLALALDAVGNHDEARTYLDRSLAIWADADETYRDAAEARATAEEWKRRAS